VDNQNKFIFFYSRSHFNYNFFLLYAVCYKKNILSQWFKARIIDFITIGCANQERITMEKDGFAILHVSVQHVEDFWSLRCGGCFSYLSKVSGSLEK